MDEPDKAKKIFSGDFRHAIDDKSRITVPAPWRRGSEGEEFFILPHPGNEYLLIMPLEEFNSVGESVKKNDKISPQQQRVFLRAFYSRARQCSTDRQGRILIPEDQRKLAGLTDEAVFVGAQTRIELWEPSRWALTRDAETVTYETVANMVGV